MNTRLSPALRYLVRSYFRSAAVLLLVLALLPAALVALAYTLSGERDLNSTFNGYSFANGIFGLVLGMAALRENQRVLNQNGVSRKTVFLADAAALAAVSALVAVGATVILAAYQAVLGPHSPVEITDLYQSLYGPEGLTPGLLARVAVLSALTTWSLAGLGQLCSALYWRLNKPATVAVSVGAPLALILAVNWLGGAATPLKEAILTGIYHFALFLSRSPWNLAAVLLVMGAVCFAVTWPLLRRANIRAAKQ